MNRELAKATEEKGEGGKRNKESVRERERERERQRESGNVELCKCPKYSRLTLFTFFFFVVITPSSKNHSNVFYFVTNLILIYCFLKNILYKYLIIYYYINKNI